MSALAEGLGIRAVARVFEVDPSAVLQGLVEVADHATAFSRYFLHDVRGHWFRVMGMAKCRRLAGKPSYYGYSIIDPIHPEMRSMTWNCYRSNAQRATLLS